MLVSYVFLLLFSNQVLFLCYPGPYEPHRLNILWSRDDDLDENLQKAYHRFLEIRGIKPNITEFMADYMADKAGRERLHWLNDVKSFLDM
ncbi:hypothetical protein DY000_02001398 [Brassica cretica]|uniref:Uncharacterized protein n=1 Tax=Brassica cretica TaxID=69181 RepID=A0ABQ7BYL9_BRACR|nr:hypothetical protein DY000_02001398 [Brassica cretica]